MNESDLAQAYRATTYQLTVNGQQVPVRIGEPAGEMAVHLPQVNAQSWAFITAWNPHSNILSAPENARRNARLFQQLAAKAYAPAIAIPDSTDWPREPGFVVFDIPLTELLALAETHEQHAVVVGQNGGAPELIWVGKAATAE
ncbi:MAG: DUF3293 domain-containing protein [Granulosicoccaceae bacterium]